jgi:DNA-binding NtrC family response regulator
LSAAVQQGEFRADLYFRLNVVPLTLPPLRDRVEDIPALARYFVKRFTEPGNDPPRLTEEFICALEKRRWPGNVREFANVIRRAMIFSDQTALSLSSLSLSAAPLANEDSIANSQSLTLRDAERELFRAALAQTNGNRTRTAEKLGVSLRTVRNKIRAYGLAPRVPA